MEHVFALFPRLAERRRARAGTLSGGERRMLAIGTSLMAQPKILLLDEPSSDLAPTIADFVFERIGRIHKERGVPILLVEQNVRRALRVSGRACVLVAGRTGSLGPGNRINGAAPERRLPRGRIRMRNRTPSPWPPWRLESMMGRVAGIHGLARRSLRVAL